MKLLRLYENIIREGQAKSCVAKFGVELFGDQLNGKEANTSTEELYLKYIERFTEDNFGVGLTADFAKSIHHLKSCVSSYPEVLVPSKTTVYRGEVIPVTWFLKNKVQFSNTPVGFTYETPAPIQSWTENRETAAGFTFEATGDGHWEEMGEEFLEYMGRGTDGEDRFFTEVFLKKYSYLKVPIILEHYADESEFIFKAKYFDALSSNPGEMEVLRLGNEPLSTDLTVSFDSLPRYAGKALLMINQIIEFGLESGEDYEVK